MARKDAEPQLSASLVLDLSTPDQSLWTGPVWASSGAGG